MVARRVHLNSMENENNLYAQEQGNVIEEGLLLLREWIIEALNAKKAGDSRSYQILISELKNFHEDPQKFKVFSQCVACFDEKYHEQLINQILCINFWTCSIEVSEAISDLIIHLIAANSSFLNTCLNFVVNNFLPPSSAIPNFMNGVFAGEVTALNAQMLQSVKSKKDEQLSRKKDIFIIILKLMKKILEITPMSNLRIQPIILQKMPHKLVEKDFQCVYIELIFEICSSDFAKTFGDNLLMAVIDRLVEIDVEIRWEDIIKSEEENESKIFLFHMDMEDENEENEKDYDDDENDHKYVAPTHGLICAKGKKIPSLDEMANKMDHLMDLFFNYIKKCFEENRLDQIFNSLLKSFELTILNTYKSKFIQFLLFYACSLSPENLSSKFCSFLLKFILDVSKPRNFRMACCAYLASFLARAKFIPSFVIMQNISNLADWCLEYSEKDKKSATNFYLNASDFFLKKKIESQLCLIHGPFFSACQALFYILCYRMHELLTEYKTEKNLKNLPIFEIINSPLSPLSKCLGSVAHEFLKQTKMYHLFSIFSKKTNVERKLNFENMHISAEKDKSKAETNFCHFDKFGDEEKLETFFPFDPYLLNYSSRFIRPIFNNWKQALPDDLSDDESDEDNDDNDDNQPHSIQNNSDVDNASDDDDDDKDDADDMSERMQMSLDSNPPFCSSSAERELNSGSRPSKSSMRKLKMKSLDHLIDDIYTTHAFDDDASLKTSLYNDKNYTKVNEKQIVGSYYSDVSDDFVLTNKDSTNHNNANHYQYHYQSEYGINNDDASIHSPPLQEMPTRLYPSFMN